MSGSGLPVYQPCFHVMLTGTLNVLPFELNRFSFRMPLCLVSRCVQSLDRAHSGKLQLRS